MPAKRPIKDPLHDIHLYIAVFQSLIGPRMYAVFALVLVASVAEGVGILMLLPLLAALDAGFAGAADTNVGQVMQKVSEVIGVGDSITGILVLIFGFFLLKAVFIFFADAYKAYLHAELDKNIKLRMLSGYTTMNFHYYLSKDTGYFVNVITNQIAALLNAFNHLISFGAGIVTTGIYLSLALAVAWRFGVTALLIGVPILLTFRILNAWVREVSRKEARESGVLSHFLIQILQSLKYLISTNNASRLETKASKSIERLKQHRVHIGIAAAFSKAVQEPIVIAAILAIVAFQLVLLNQPVGPIIVSIILFNRSLNALLDLQKTWQYVVSKLGGVEMVRDEIKNLRLEREVSGQKQLTGLRECIRFDNVHFSYDSGPPVLRGVSIEIPARSTVAFIGSSGAGKSTLVDILTLVLKPSRGHVIIDGVPGNDVDLPSWRSQIGYVSQESVIFDDTVANNICLWMGDPKAEPETMARIHEVARQAQIHEFIESLPAGYDMVVGDRGVRLSGGQKQRLFIARELFRKPDLLVLDEATSALDSESEIAINRSIDLLKGSTTVVIIAHRLSTIRNVDKVFILDGGRLIETGEYDKLRADIGSRLNQMIALQAL